MLGVCSKCNMVDFDNEHYQFSSVELWWRHCCAVWNASFLSFWVCSISKHHLNWSTDHTHLQIEILRDRVHSCSLWMVHNQYSILDNTSCTTILDCKHIFLKQCVHHKTDFTCSYTPELYCLKIDSFDTNCLQSYVIHVPVNWLYCCFNFV